MISQIESASSMWSVLPAVSKGLFFPEPTSTTAKSVDNLFYFILSISVIFFVLIVTLMVFFVWKYRARPGVGPQPSPSHNNWLEMLWSVIPGCLVGGIFVWGFWSYMDMRQPPDDSYEVQVVAKKWSWSFVYPNGHIDNNLHVPVDRPVRLVMSSDDVIHSLYVPAFRIKKDLVPGRYSTTWFEAQKVGEYTLFCAEYCGTQHSTMLAKVVVHPSGEFETWLDRRGEFPGTHDTRRGRRTALPAARMCSVSFDRRQRENRAHLQGSVWKSPASWSMARRLTWTRTTCANRSSSRKRKSEPATNR